MINKSLVILIVLLLTFSMSCTKQSKSSMEDDYISEIEEEYKKSSGSDVVAEINNDISSSSDNANNTDNNANNTDNNQFNYNQVNNASEYTSVKPRRPLKATIYNFYSPWTSQDDPLIIKEIRVMIANKEYTQALNYINKLDINNLPPDVDLGHLYQFKGIVHYFLSKDNKSNIALADECFKKVEGLTSIEKFKPLSLLWNGMLYQTYSADEAQLNEAISLFDRIITEYPRTRFANDAVFYKAVTMKKLGMPENEYNDLFLSVKRGGFVDTLVFSQVINDYVPADDLVDKEMLK
ncbi:hypothetical protein [uncultured Brachyspira sp.]|uniref:tetratricopeptide repeat protein n=1 Tax=uncultured Brachyspira sp. TaxID=221953 RepID=UPI0025FAA247|nr:hypothetical protein [uncultured Brachyspira sp.]